MTWIKVKRQRVTSDEPSITITKERMSFNVVFVKLAEIEKNEYVNIFVDDENRKIGFEFKKTNDDNDLFKIAKLAGKYSYCSSREVLDRPWVSKVAELKGSNVFVARQEGKKWTISLCPAFEISYRRDEIKSIEGNPVGIYRYIDSGRIVYIGKGKIKDRLNSIGREKWKFDIIEFSVIENEDQALEWESFWIDKYKLENRGQLPTYNLISGTLVSC